VRRLKFRKKIYKNIRRWAHKLCLHCNIFIYTRHIWINLRERDHWGDPDLDGRIILRWIFRKWEGVVRTG
jgi:hypothetical protein